MKITNEEYKEQTGSTLGARLGIEFTFEEVRDFLERHEYDVLIREQRYRGYNGEHRNTHESLFKRAVVVPKDTLVADTIPESARYEMGLQDTFIKVLTKQLLKL